MRRFLVLALATALLVLVTLVLLRAPPADRGERQRDAETLLYFKFDNSMRNTYSRPLAKHFHDVFEALATEGRHNPRRFSPAPVATHADMVFFDSLTYVDDLMHRLPRGVRPSFVYGIAGSDQLAGKERLYAMLRDTRDPTLLALLPRTYRLLDPRDIALLEREFDPAKLYILKSNVQRQQGNTLTNSLDYIRHQTAQAASRPDRPSHVVCQEVLQDPLLVGGRKINLRVYLLVRVAPDGQVSAYAYKDGFIYYTPAKWQSGSLASDVHITTGYIDRRVYEENPLTLQDLRGDLGEERHAQLFEGIVSALRGVMRVYEPWFRRANAGVPGTKFMVYGCDVAPDADLGVKVMEVNKGPDLGYKDERDRAVKFEMVKEMVQVVVQGQPCRGFVQLL